MADLTIQEKLLILYYGLELARDLFLSETEIAALHGWITPKEKRDWEHFFTGEYWRCRKIKKHSYQDLAYLEFKVRHLINLAIDICFDETPAWKGYNIAFENTFFPFLSHAGSGDPASRL